LIIPEQFLHHTHGANVCIAFCNILKNAITTIEWREDNFHLTRTIKPHGTFAWPRENLGECTVISSGAFEHLLSHKKYEKTIGSH